ncbi:patatin-like phospholipase family protein [Flexivirga sp. ID2601S]|uniref:Patatin-like phospholipase family protein n=1 Tax=Flexivirga aerilata TaxID=1656889 RepID=A0A849AMN2_9MICO|nr:patatin-like phospholipase family protein [Flexivirga aerilata]NNG40631.1 patatin-like phospholipase family protein [Flexivirga aerilata]
MTAPAALKTAFVLGGGGVLGATQIGAMRALLQRGITPDLVVGTSIGAINGSFVAAEPSEDGIEALGELWAGLGSGRLLFDTGTSRGRRRWRPGRLRTHLYSPGPLLRILRQELPVQTFEELQVPFQCVAASVEHAVSHWFSSGKLPEAIAASCAVPGLFPAMRIGDEHFFDGGLVHSIPVGRAVSLGATDVYVLQVGRVEQALSPPRWPWQVGQVTFEIARRHRYLEEIASVPDRVRLHVLPTGTSDAPMVSLLHINRAFVLGRVNSAYDAAHAYLDEEERRSS